MPIILDEFFKFVGLFNNAGISISEDICEPDDGRISKNIIKQEPTEIDLPEGRYTKLWKRIDLGPESLSIDFDKTLKFLLTNKESLIKSLEPKRYDMIYLMAEFLSNYENTPNNFPDFKHLQTLFMILGNLLQVTWVSKE